MVPTLFVRARLLQALLLAATQMPGCSGNTRVVGNVPWYEYREDYMHWEGLTHVICGWMVGREDGSFDVYREVIHCAAEARWVGKIVHVGLGGIATLKETWFEMMNKANVQRTANRLVEHVNSMYVQGLNLDLEDDVVVHPSFKDFVSTLHTTFSKLGLKLSGNFRKSAVERGLLGETLRLFDFVNIRAFDILPTQAPWRFTAHPSSFNIAVQELKYYTEVLGLNRSNLNLGLPLHGWVESVAGHEPWSRSWGRIAMRYPNDLHEDFTHGIWFNGWNTMRHKIHFALESGVGLAIFGTPEDTMWDKDCMTCFINETIVDFEGNKTGRAAVMGDGTAVMSEVSTHDEQWHTSHMTPEQEELLA